MDPIDLFGSEWSKDDLRKYIGHANQLMGVKSLQATEGLERGNRLLDVRNGSGLRFYVSADRGMDISYLEFAGIPIAWRSSVGDAAPAYFDPGSSGWLRNFPGGLFVTGGLTQFGQPNVDEGDSLGLHGRASNLPAYRVNVDERWEQGQFVMEVSGEVRQSAVYGEDLTLKRSIRVVGGDNEIHIRDTVSNEGMQSAPHMLLYHFNFGFPFISPNSFIRIPSRGAHSEVVLDGMNKGLDRWNRFDPPQAHARDEIFLHTVPSDDEYGVLEIVNPRLRSPGSMIVRLSYRLKELPYLYNWKMLRSGMYVLGVEPANCRGINGRADARKYGLPVLEPGESVDYHLVLRVGFEQDETG